MEIKKQLFILFILIFILISLTACTLKSREDVEYYNNPTNVRNMLDPKKLDFYTYKEIYGTFDKDTNKSYLEAIDAAKIIEPSQYALIDNKKMTIDFFGHPSYYYFIYVIDDQNNILYREKIKNQKMPFHYTNTVNIDGLPQTIHGEIVIYANYKDIAPDVLTGTTWSSKKQIAFIRSQQRTWLDLKSPMPYSTIMNNEIVIEGKLQVPTQQLKYVLNDGLSISKKES